MPWTSEAGQAGQRCDQDNEAVFLTRRRRPVRPQGSPMGNALSGYRRADYIALGWQYLDLRLHGVLD